MYCSRPYRLRLLIADASTSIREALTSIFVEEPEIEVVGTAADVQQAVESSSRLLPDVVILDVGLAGATAIQATHRIRMVHPGVQVISWSILDEAEYRQSLLAAGAAAYVSKADGVDVLLATIRRCRPASMSEPPLAKAA